MQTVDREQLKQMLDSGESFFLINVLDPRQFHAAHIPGSYNVPGSDQNFADGVRQLVATKDAKVVVYCASFECNASPKAAQRLDQDGFTQVFDYAGGMRDWQEAGYPVETTRRRQYS